MHSSLHFDQHLGRDAALFTKSQRRQLCGHCRRLSNPEQARWRCPAHSGDQQSLADASSHVEVLRKSCAVDTLSGLRQVWCLSRSSLPTCHKASAWCTAARRGHLGTAMKIAVTWRHSSKPWEHVMQCSTQDVSLQSLASCWGTQCGNVCECSGSPLLAGATTSQLGCRTS